MKLLSLHMPTPERITGYFRYGTRYFRFAVEKGKDPQIGQEFPSTEYGDIDTFGRMIKKQEPEVVIRKDLPLVPDLKFDTLFKYAEELTGKQHH